MSTTTTVRALRRNNFGTVQIASSGGNTQGDIIQLADGRIAVVSGLEAIADTDLMTGDTTGQFDILKNATTDTYALGAPVYYDPTAKKAKTSSADGYYYAGRCVKASANGDVYVCTEINQYFPGRVSVAAVAATGSLISDAAALIEGMNVVSAADDTKGVILPVAVAGMIVYVKSTVANKILKIWPQTGAAINAVTASAALSLASGPTPTVLIATSATQWYTIPLLPS